MDIKIEQLHKKGCRIFKEYEQVDLIPYAIAVVMIVGYAYLIHQFMHIKPSLT